MQLRADMIGLQRQLAHLQNLIGHTYGDRGTCIASSAALAPSAGPCQPAAPNRAQGPAHNHPVVPDRGWHAQGHAPNHPAAPDRESHAQRQPAVPDRPEYALRLIHEQHTEGPCYPTAPRGMTESDCCRSGVTQGQAHKLQNTAHAEPYQPETPQHVRTSEGRGHPPNSEASMPLEALSELINRQVDRRLAEKTESQKKCPTHNNH